MTDEHFDEAFERMRMELNVTPSPEFAVRVRQQNEHSPARSTWSLWVWAGATAACAAVVISVVLWRSPAPEPQAQTVRDLTPPSAAQAVGETTPVSTIDRASRTSRRTSAPIPEIVAAATTTELEVLVPPDQLIAIRQLMSSMRRGVGVDVAPPLTLVDPDTGELITLKPIEIPLITVTPLPGDPEGRSGGRENR